MSFVVGFCDLLPPIAPATEIGFQRPRIAEDDLEQLAEQAVDARIGRTARR
jgi:hypothetical protein